jgi:hypothetical protein
MMIVTRGLGRGSRGALVASGLTRRLVEVVQAATGWVEITTLKTQLQRIIERRAKEQEKLLSGKAAKQAKYLVKVAAKQLDDIDFESQNADELQNGFGQAYLKFLEVHRQNMQAASAALPTFDTFLELVVLQMQRSSDDDMLLLLVNE